MTLKLLISKKFVNAETLVYVREGNNVLAMGSIEKVEVKRYLNRPIEAFTWDSDGIVYTDLK